MGELTKPFSLEADPPAWIHTGWKEELTALYLIFDVTGDGQIAQDDILEISACMRHDWAYRAPPETSQNLISLEAFIEACTRALHRASPEEFASFLVQLKGAAHLARSLRAQNSGGGLGVPGGYSKPGALNLPGATNLFGGRKPPEPPAGLDHALQLLIQQSIEEKMAPVREMIERFDSSAAEKVALVGAQVQRVENLIPQLNSSTQSLEARLFASCTSMVSRVAYDHEEQLISQIRECDEKTAQVSAANAQCSAAVFQMAAACKAEAFEQVNNFTSTALSDVLADVKAVEGSAKELAELRVEAIESMAARVAEVKGSIGEQFAEVDGKVDEYLTEDDFGLADFEKRIEALSQQVEDTTVAQHQKIQLLQLDIGERGRLDKVMGEQQMGYNSALQAELQQASAEWEKHGQQQIDQSELRQCEEIAEESRLRRALAVTLDQKLNDTRGPDVANLFSSTHGAESDALREQSLNSLKTIIEDRDDVNGFTHRMGISLKELQEAIQRHGDLIDNMTTHLGDELSANEKSFARFSK